MTETIVSVASGGKEGFTASSVFHCSVITLLGTAAENGWYLTKFVFKKFNFTGSGCLKPYRNSKFVISVIITYKD
jgi:hypothetical protein